MTNTRPSESDAIQVARYRRLPLPDTAHTRAYVEMMHEVTAFHDALVAADPTQDQLAQLTTTLASLRQMLEGQAVDEQHRIYGRGSMGGSKTQALMPTITMDHVDDDELQAHTVAGNYFAGMNNAMHGGVVSVLFDTVMGRLAMGTQLRICRTAYLTTQYRNVTPIGERLELRAHVESTQGRKRFITGQLWHADTLCAEADALFIELKPGQA